MTTRFQWVNPHQWLLEHFRDAEPDERARVATRLMQRVDADTIQDLFQAEMERDGYFEPFITWHCITCEAENEDHPDLTSCPLCCRCGAEYDWDDLHEHNDWLEEQHGIPTNRGD